MTDTPPEVQALHARLLSERSPEERFRMALSMGRTARTIVWSSLAHLPDPERRVQFFLRLYGSDFPPQQREEIAAHIRGSAPAPLAPAAPRR